MFVSSSPAARLRLIDFLGSRGVESRFRGGLSTCCCCRRLPAWGVEGDCVKLSDLSRSAGERTDAGNEGDRAIDSGGVLRHSANEFTGAAGDDRAAERSSLDRFRDVNGAADWRGERSESGVERSSRSELAPSTTRGCLALGDAPAPEAAAAAAMGDSTSAASSSDKAISSREARTSRNCSLNGRGRCGEEDSLFSLDAAAGRERSSAPSSKSPETGDRGRLQKHRK